MKVLLISRTTFPTINVLVNLLAERDDIEEVIWLTNKTNSQFSSNIESKINENNYKKSYFRNISKLKTIHLYEYDKFFNITFSIPNFLRKTKPDIVLFHYSDGFAGVFYGKKAIIGGLLSLPLLVLSRLYCKNIVFWMSNLDDSKIMKLQSKFLYPIISKLSKRLFVNEKISLDLVVECNGDKNKVAIIPEPPLIVPEDYEQQTNALNLPSDTCNIILSFGAIEKRKGLDLIIQSMPIILKTHPDTRLIIAGPITHDNAFADIQSLVNETNSDKIQLMPKFFSNVELIELIRYSDVVLNLQQEQVASSGSFGVAAFFDKCTIVSNNAMFNRHIVDKFNGRFVKRTVEDVAKCIVEVLDSPIDQERMGKNLGKTFRNSHNKKRIGDLLMNEFTSILDDKIKLSFVDYETCIT